MLSLFFFFFFSSRRRHTRLQGDWSSDVCSSDLRAVRLAGRFQVVPGEVEWILDIAHNPPAAEVLARQLRERAQPGGRGPGRTFAVIGVLADKDEIGRAHV